MYDISPTSLLKRERYQPEHKAPKHHIEVAMSDLHRNCTNYIGISHAVSGNVPAASGEPRKRGSIERCRRERRRAPQSPSPFSLTAPARRETVETAQLHEQNLSQTNETNPRTESVHKQALGRLSGRSEHFVNGFASPAGHPAFPRKRAPRIRAPQAYPVIPAQRRDFTHKKRIRAAVILLIYRDI